MTSSTIVGVVAQEPGEPSVNPLPAGAIAILDFINEAYIYGATSYTLAESIDHPEFLTSSGLRIGNGNSSSASAEILGPFKTYLVAGDWTVVIEFITTEFDNSQPFNLSGPSTSYLNLQDDEDLCDSVEFGSVFRYVENTGLGDAGVPRGVALTRTDVHTVISTDGSVINENTTAGGFGDVNKAWFGGSSHSSNDGKCLIGRLVIYPSQNNSQLPTLSVASVMTTIALLDFVTGVYVFEGVAIPLASAISIPARVSASGLAIDTPPIELLGQFLDLILTGEFQITMEYELTSAATSGNTDLLNALSNTLADRVNFSITALYGEGFDESEGDGDSTRDIFDDPDPTAIVGLNTVIFTRQITMLSYTNNGVTVTNTTDLNNIALDHVQIASASAAMGHIRSIRFTAL